MRIAQVILILVAFFSCSETALSQILKYNPYFVRDGSDTIDVAITRLNQLGEYYYDESWNAGNIYLVNGDSLMGYYIRYNIVNNSLELIVDNAFQSINKSNIAGFDWFSANRLNVERFINRNELDFGTDKMLTYFPELLIDGEVTLLKVKELISHQSADSPLLVNNEMDRIVVMDKLFYFRNGELTEVSGGKNRNLRFFNSEELEDYVRENNFNFSNEGDVKRTVDFYNKTVADQ